MCIVCVEKTLIDFLEVARSNLTEKGYLVLTIPSVALCSNTPENVLSMRQRSSRRTLKFQANSSTSTSRHCVVILRVIKLILENLELRTNITTRDIYYQDVQLFKSQDVVNTAVEQICINLGVPRSFLKIMPSPKGLIVGDMTIVLKDPVDKNHPVTTISRANGPALIPVGSEIETISFTEPHNVPSYILLVEKEGVFTHLYSHLPEAIIITGKGFPDHYTRKFLFALHRMFPWLHIYGLVDSDVHGLQILRTYQAAGRNTLEFHYPIRAIEFLGVGIMDYKDGWMNVTQRERRLLMCMFQKDWILEDEYQMWKAEAQRQQFMGKKAEMNILDRDHITRLVDYVRARVHPGVPPISLSEGVTEARPNNQTGDEDEERSENVNKNVSTSRNKRATKRRKNEKEDLSPSQRPDMDNIDPQFLVGMSVH